MFDTTRYGTNSQDIFSVLTYLFSGRSCDPFSSNKIARVLQYLHDARYSTHKHKSALYTNAKCTPYEYFRYFFFRVRIYVLSRISPSHYACLLRKYHTKEASTFRRLMVWGHSGTRVIRARDVVKAGQKWRIYKHVSAIISLVRKDIQKNIPEEVFPSAPLFPNEAHVRRSSFILFANHYAVTESSPEDVRMGTMC